ncbi:MAG: hypothetical protein CSYNP_03349 [Syntrophus sp. SKADARSKE-3]|nr:hypothetical protein [Syntrophus sp. SKADARSKE-3]
MKHKLWAGLLIALVLSVSLILSACSGSSSGAANPTYNIYGTATLNGSALQGVSIILSGASSATTTTDASGNYTFTGLAHGSYTITPSMTGYTFNPVNTAVTISGANSTRNNFTATVDSSVKCSISGTVSGVGNLLVTMTLTGDSTGSTVTDTSGNYIFSGLSNGSYIITPSLSGYNFSPISKSVPISGANSTGNNFKASAVAATYSISGTVSGTANGSTTTDTNGNYSFTGLANGSYTIAPSLSGYTFNPATLSVSINGLNSTGNNFTDMVTTTPTTTSTTTLTTSSTSVTFGTSITLVATVLPSDATGTVTFYDGSTSLGSATLSSGSATLTISSLSVGSHTFTAGYSGSSTYSSNASNSVTTTVISSSTGNWTSGACGYGTAAYLLNSGTLSESGKYYTTSTKDQSAICVTGTSTALTLTNPTITTSGNTSSTDNSSFYGLDAAVLNYNGGSLTITGGTVTTSGQGANNVFSYGTGTVTINNATVTATGANGHGLYAAGGGTLYANHVTASSTGSSASIVATDKGGGTITIVGGSYSASGQRSAGIYSTGTVTASGGATFSATNAEAIVIEGSNTITLTDSILTAVSSTSEHRGIFLYQSMSGDANNSTCGTGACFTMTGGSFTYTDTTNSSSSATSNCAAFVVANQVAHFVLTDVTISNSCPTLLLSALNSNWNYNGGTTTFKAYGETMAGNVIVDSVSSADIYLYSSSKKASTLTGTINSANTGKTVALNLDSSSKWVVTGTSYLTSLTNANSNNSNITCQTSGCKVYVGGTAITIN